VRLLSYNIRMGGSGRETLLAGVIRSCEPDVVVLEEAYVPAVVERLARECGMQWHGSRPGHSVAFLSRLQPAHFAWHDIWFARRSYMELVLAKSNTRIYGVHLSAIHSNVTEQRRTFELRALMDGIQSHTSSFHVLTGDFNTLVPGEQFDISKLPLRLRLVTWLTGGSIRWTTLQILFNKGYSDAYRLFHKDPGYTFPTWDPHVRLDYLFVPSRFAARVTGCSVVQDAPGVRDASDHLPLLSTLAD
jgi:endonuclease/exonuclease/phosphatase family metal-dependent hydrolase